MAEKKTIKHRDGTKQITLWIDEKLLDKWNEFAANYGVNRTNLIISSVNEFMRERAPVNGNGVSKMIEEKFQEIKDVLDTKVELPVEIKNLVNDPEVRNNLLELLELKPMDSEKLSRLAKMDEMTVVDVLSELKHDKIVQINKEGMWSVIEE